MLSLNFPHPALFEPSPLQLCFDHMLDLNTSLLHPRALGLVKKETGKTNMRKTKQGYELTLEAPGVSADDFELTYDEKDRIMKIAVKRDDMHLVRSVRLPEDANAKTAKVTLELGILRMSFGKDEMKPPFSLDLADTTAHPTGDETYRVSIAAPGVAPADLNVVVHPDPRVHEIELNGGSTVYGTTYAIDKRVHLPRDAEAKDAVVSLANGILTLTVPKRAAEEASTPAKKMKLTIESPSEPAKAAEAEAEAPME